MVVIPLLLLTFASNADQVQEYALPSVRKGLVQVGFTKKAGNVLGVFRPSHMTFDAKYELRRLDDPEELIESWEKPAYFVRDSKGFMFLGPKAKPKIDLNSNSLESIITVTGITRSGDFTLLEQGFHFALVHDGEVRGSISTFSAYRPYLVMERSGKAVSISDDEIIRMTVQEIGEEAPITLSNPLVGFHGLSLLPNSADMVQVDNTVVAFFAFRKADPGYLCIVLADIESYRVKDVFQLTNMELKISQGFPSPVRGCLAFDGSKFFVEKDGKMFAYSYSPDK